MFMKKAGRRTRKKRESEEKADNFNGSKSLKLPAFSYNIFLCIRIFVINIFENIRYFTF